MKKKKTKHKKILITSSIIFLIALFLSGFFYFWLNSDSKNNISSSIEANLFSLADVSGGNGVALSASCDATPPYEHTVGECCVSNYGNFCNSAANSCGKVNSGTVQCDGTCSTELYKCPSYNNTDGSTNVCPDPYTCNGQYQAGSTCIGSNHGDPCQFYHPYSCTAPVSSPPETSCPYALTVQKSGTGTVTSSPAGINCGSTCSSSFSNGANVTLTADPSSGIFSGNCTGTGICSLTMNAAKNVTATFCVPVYSCQTISTNNCDSSNYGQTIATKTKRCVSSCFPYEYNSSKCSSCNDETMTCPDRFDKNWREVAP